MLMPSAMTGWASPAILPVKKIPSSWRGADAGTDRPGGQEMAVQRGMFQRRRARPGGFQDMAPARLRAALPPWRWRARVSASRRMQQDKRQCARHRSAPSRHSRRERPAAASARRQPLPVKCALKAKRSEAFGGARHREDGPCAFHEPQAAITMRAAISSPSSSVADNSRSPSRHGRHLDGLEQPRARRHRRIAQHHVQMLAAQRPAPAPVPRRAQHRIAGIDTDPRHRRPGGRDERRRHAASFQHRHGGGGDEFAAHLAAGKFALLHQRDRPAGLRQQPRRRRAGGAGAHDHRHHSAWARMKQMGEGKDAVLASRQPAPSRPQAGQFAAPQNRRAHWPPRHGGSHHWRPARTPCARPAAQRPSAAARRRQSLWPVAPPAPAAARAPHRPDDAGTDWR